MDGIDEKRSTLLGVLSSHPRIFNKIRKNEWELIPDEVTGLDNLCKQYGVPRENFEEIIDDNGTMTYSWIRVKKQKEGFSRREVHYLVSTMRKNGESTMLPDSAQIANV